MIAHGQIDQQVREPVCGKERQRDDRLRNARALPRHFHQQGEQAFLLLPDRLSRLRYPRVVLRGLREQRAAQLPVAHPGAHQRRYTARRGAARSS